MNKLLKGSIAGAAGVALLLGGAGTFAYWNDSETLTGQTATSIVSGNLAVTNSTETGFWTANGKTMTTLDGYLVVPGDVITYTKTMSILATGDKLVATLDLAETSISPVKKDKEADVKLAEYLEDSAILTATGSGIVNNNDTMNTFTITPAAGEINQNVTVVATIEFPESGLEGTENIMMNGAVTLNNMTLNLTQTVVPVVVAAQ